MTSFIPVELFGYVHSQVHFQVENGASACCDFINVFSSTNFVLLTDLTSDVEYQFEVVAVAELDGDTVMGARSDNFTERLTPTSLPTTQSNIAQIIGGVIAFIVAVSFVAVVVVILLFFVRSRLGLLLPSHS